LTNVPFVHTQRAGRGHEQYHIEVIKNWGRCSFSQLLPPYQRVALQRAHVAPLPWRTAYAGPQGLVGRPSQALPGQLARNSHDPLAGVARQGRATLRLPAFKDR
jgi:hypothetical protein